MYADIIGSAGRFVLELTFNVIYVTSVPLLFSWQIPHRVCDDMQITATCRM
jgi:hypothetical protein